MRLNVQALQRIGNRPRFHGNGFIQLYLNSSMRLHVWHHGFPASVTNAQIHDHKFTVDSEVLYGRLSHITYDVGADLDGWYALNQVRSSDPKDGPIDAKHDRVSIRETGHNIFSSGSRYRFPMGEFHETKAEHGIVVTVMRKVDEDVHKSPLVLCPWGDTVDHAFDPTLKPPSEGDLWAAIDHALHLLPPATQIREFRNVSQN